MSNTLTVISDSHKRLNIYELVSQMGLTIGNHPHLFSDCFDFTGIKSETIKKFKGTLSGLSKVLNSLIPNQIDSKFTHPYELITRIENQEKFGLNPTIIKYRDIINKNLIRIIGFLIVKNHKECEEYPQLMKIREVIQAAQNTVREGCIGANKGPRAEETKDVVTQSISAQNCDIISKDVTKIIKGYLEIQMYEKNDPDAFKIMQLMYFEKKKLLPIPKENEVN